MKTAPMAGKSWQPSHEPPRHAEGTPSKAMASSERMGLMAEAKPEPHEPRPSPEAPSYYIRLGNSRIIPARRFYQLPKGWCPPVYAHTKDKLRSTSDPWS